jgi:hypothetical protein
VDGRGEAAAFLDVSVERDVLDDRVRGREPFDRRDRRAHRFYRSLGLSRQRARPGHHGPVAAHPA